MTCSVAEKETERLLGVMEHFSQGMKQTEIKKAIYLEGESRQGIFLKICNKRRLKQYVWNNTNIYFCRIQV